MPPVDNKTIRHIDIILGLVESINQENVTDKDGRVKQILQLIERSKETFQAVLLIGSQNNAYQQLILATLDAGSELTINSPLIYEAIVKYEDIINQKYDDKLKINYNQIALKLKVWKTFFVLQDLYEKEDENQFDLNVLVKEVSNLLEFLSNDVIYLMSLSSRLTLLNCISYLTHLLSREYILQKVSTNTDVLICIGGTLLQINRQKQLLFSELFRLLKESEDRSEEETMSFYNSMQYGKEYDPLMVLYLFLDMIYPYCKPTWSSIKNDFLTLSKHLFAELKEAGPQHYKNNKVMNGLLAFLIEKTLRDNLRSFSQEEDEQVLKSLYHEIVVLLEYYFEYINRPTVHDVFLAITLYGFTGKKEVIKRVDRIIYMIENREKKVDFAFFLIVALESSGNFAKIVQFLDHALFSELKQSDHIFVPYIYSKVKRNHETANEIKPESSSLVPLQLPITDEERERVKKIKSVTWRECYQLAYVSIAFGEQDSAIMRLENLVDMPTIDKNDHNQLFKLISYFCEVFLYSASAHKNRDVIFKIEDIYKKLNDKFTTLTSAISHCLLKLYIFNRDEAAIQAMINKLAIVDARYMAYLDFMKSNPTISTEEKNRKLSELTQVLSADDVSVLNELETNVVNTRLIEEAIRLSFETKEQESIREDEEEVINTLSLHTLQINDETTIDWSDCMLFYDHQGQECYIYFEPKLLENITDSVLREQFEKELLEPTAARDYKQNGIKKVSEDVYEIKINADPRVLGFRTKATLQNNTQEIDLIIFCGYCPKPHGKNNHPTSQFSQRITSLQARANSCKFKAILPKDPKFQKSPT
jgi:hypothetical protein